jgi:hypothetical protein
VEKNLEVLGLDRFIYQWNMNNPIDRWFRKRYKISFNSPQHRVISVYDQAMEYREDLIFNKMKTSIDSTPYIPGEDIFKPLSELERENMFNNLNVDSLLDAIEK